MHKLGIWVRLLRQTALKRLRRDNQSELVPLNLLVLLLYLMFEYTVASGSIVCLEQQTTGSVGAIRWILLPLNATVS